MDRASWWPSEGQEPDPRWSLANERTLLAYGRTALALVLAGLAVVSSRAVAGTPVGVAALGLPVILLGGAVSLAGRRRFLEAQVAMRTGQDLPAPEVAMLLPWGIALFAGMGLVVGATELVAG